jgi:phosphoribosylanthranilate isomerase
MPLKSLIKVSKISNLSDARYCSGMGVEMIGFRMIPGQADYMSPALFQEIRGWVSGPKVVAELYGLREASEIQFVVEKYAPDYFELTLPEYKAFREVLGLPCIVHLPVGVTRSLALNEEKNITYLLLDEAATCKDLEGDFPALIKVSSLESLSKKNSEGCFKGFVLETSGEARPGVTNYEQLGTILESLDDDSQ